MCAPVSSSQPAWARKSPSGRAEGLKHASAIHGDGLVSLRKSALTDYVGSLGPQQLAALHVALKLALDLLD